MLMAGCHWQTSRGDTICISADNVVSHLDYLLEHVRRLLSLCACVHIAQHRALRPPPDRRRALMDYIIIGGQSDRCVCKQPGSLPLRRKTARWIFAGSHVFVDLIATSFVCA